MRKVKWPTALRAQIAFNSLFEMPSHLKAAVVTGNVVAFNSLFEMLRAVHVRGNGRHLLKLSILYLRCTTSAWVEFSETGMVFQFSIWDAWFTPGLGDNYNVFLSILYLRCIATNAPRTIIRIPYIFQFSIWDASVTWYGTPWGTISSFNSLFEMRDVLQRRGWVGRGGYFQFSIWDANYRNA